MTPDRTAAAAQRAMEAARRAREAEARVALLKAGRPAREEDLARARAAATRSAGWAHQAQQWFTTAHERTANTHGRSNGSSGQANGDLMRRVVEALGRLARLQTRQDDPLPDAVKACAQALGPHCAASLLVGPPQEPSGLARHGTLCEVADEAQRDTGEGPTADAWSKHVVVGSARLATDPRWPEFTRRMQDSQVTSVVAIPVLVADRPVAVVTACTTDPVELAHLDVPVLESLARGVATLLQTQECARLRAETRQLQEALTSRAVIDQAIGILMAHGHCDADQAFQQLKTASRNSNVKLREIARRLVRYTQDGHAPPPL